MKSAAPLAGSLLAIVAVTIGSWGPLSTPAAADPPRHGHRPPDGLSPEERLGKFLFFDTNLSTPAGQSCASCHDPRTGFTGPDSDINAAGAVMPGAVSRRAGNRKPPSAAYAAFSPAPYYDEADETYVGGQFWDGRAADLVEQAKQPFLNPVEMNNAGPGEVCGKVRKAAYAPLFEQVYGRGAMRDTDRMYDRIARALAAYQSSAEVNPFSSKYDAYLAGRAELTPQERRGLALYEGKAGCAACHPSQPGDDGSPPLFTDFTYDNIGVPANPDNPFYHMPRQFNPAGRWFLDFGLAGTTDEPATRGQFKVPTLRNVDKRPDRGFVKAYMHNGAFKSLKEVVHFYNARDVDDFPPPEVRVNVNRDELGDLGLTDREEDDVVAFLRMLSDGWWRK